MSRLILFASLASLLAVAGTYSAHTETTSVKAAAKPGKEWKAYSTRTLADLPGQITAAVPEATSHYGGWAGGKLEATGFFRTAKIGARWWLIDPDGCRFISKGMSSVNLTVTAKAEEAFNKKYGSGSNWVAQSLDLLREAGFNTLGAWSDYESFADAARRMPYTKLVNFMSAYGKMRGGTFQQPGHTGYTNDCIFVFDPGFETFCDENAKQLAATKDDPWLIGYFSDNEMPFKLEAIRNYLGLPASEPGHRVALMWLQQRHGNSASTNDITARDEKDFFQLVAEKYFSTVARAIKKADTNHLYLGARFYGNDKNTPELFRAAGPFVDVVSVNYYNAWTPDAEKMMMWLREAKKPFLVTEWYAKGQDSGLPNTGGAGWVVKTQRERGLFYQNFALGLLESPGCVGWCWLKYMDNDPDDKRADPSNRDSNKGILNNRYKPYTPLIELMRALNTHAYAAAEVFAQPPTAGKPKARSGKQ